MFHITDVIQVCYTLTLTHSKITLRLECVCEVSYTSSVSHTPLLLQTKTIWKGLNYFCFRFQCAVLWAFGGALVHFLCLASRAEQTQRHCAKPCSFFCSNFTLPQLFMWDMITKDMTVTGLYRTDLFSHVWSILYYALWTKRCWLNLNGINLLFHHLCAYSLDEGVKR